MFLSTPFFFLILTATWFHARGRRDLLARTRFDWVLDGINLIAQGWLLPLAQVLVVAAGLRYVWPEWSGALDVPGWIAFAIHFVGVDYIYYWNHRALHGPRLWPIHKVHHTATAMDIFASVRGPIWGGVVLVYLWANGTFVYLLNDPTPYLFSVSLSSCLSMWRHSRFNPPDWLAPFVDPWLILPRDHARHHSTADDSQNFGANLKIWDRIHGTAAAGADDHTPLGTPHTMTVQQALFWPFP